MEEEFDSGRILVQEPISYSSTDTAHNLYYKLVSEGLKTLPLAIGRALKGYKGTLQHGRPSYFTRDFPEYSEWMEKERYERASHFPTKYPSS